MNELAGKMQAVEAEVAQERGEILFFALLQAADLPHQWDVVIVAPWVTENKLRDLKYLAEKLRARLNPAELLSLARIVLLDPDESTLSSIARTSSLPTRRLSGKSPRHGALLPLLRRRSCPANSRADRGYNSGQ